MISFANDYSEGCAEEILEAFQHINRDQNPGYGLDQYCAEAAHLIQEQFAAPDAHVHFLVGGTQANLTVLAASLRAPEAVIAVDSGHINVHEAGSIEAAGHKILTVPGKQGKLPIEAADRLIDECVHNFAYEHIVRPRLIYISNTTEVGTIYTKEELQGLRQLADKWGLLIYLDGARLGSALTARDNDIAISDYARYLDAFTIGGTKNGLLFGEAVVITNPYIEQDFRCVQTQRGGMLAKSWLTGLQYRIMFTDNRYLDYARHANQMAYDLAEGLTKLGLKLAQEPVSNQLFVYLSPELHEVLQKSFIYEVQGIHDEGIEVRFCTSWATPEANVKRLLETIEAVQTQSVERK